MGRGGKGKEKEEGGNGGEGNGEKGRGQDPKYFGLEPPLQVSIVHLVFTRRTLC